MPGNNVRPSRPTIDDPEHVLDVIERIEDGPVDNAGIAAEALNAYIPMDAVPGHGDLITGTQWIDMSAIDRYRFFVENSEVSDVVEALDAWSASENEFEDENMAPASENEIEDASENEFEDAMENEFEDARENEMVDASENESENKREDPEVPDENVTHDRIDRFYNKLRNEDRPHKRRRMRHKGPAIDVPATPQVLLKHAAKARGMSSHQFKMLLVCGLPMFFINALMFIESIFPCGEQLESQCTELFSGAGMVYGAWMEHDKPATKFDIERHQTFENMLSPEGYVSAIKLIMGVSPGGLAHFATVCSTWVYLSRSSTGRSHSRPLGFASTCRVVADANCMCARVSLLLVLCAIRALVFLHEQPESSLVPTTPFFCWARSVIRQHLHQSFNRTFTWMGAYGADTQKPTQILSNAPWLHKLARPLRAERKELLLAASGVAHLPHDNRTGKRRISGASGLKQSQIYPALYGQEVYRQWSENPVAATFDNESDSDAECPWDEWRAAQQQTQWSELRIEELLSFLPVPADRPLS